MSTPERIERLWGHLCERPGHREWEEAYARWLRWMDGLGGRLGAVAWSDALAPLVASLLPGFVHPENPVFDADVLPCLRCGASIWRGMPLVLGELHSPRCRIGPEFVQLNAEPTARGRWLVKDPGVATFAPGIDLVQWPLPRYSSHLVTCPYLIARRKEEQDFVAQKMRDAGVRRKQNRADREARIRKSIDS